MCASVARLVLVVGLVGAGLGEAAAGTASKVRGRAVHVRRDGAGGAVCLGTQLVGRTRGWDDHRPPRRQRAVSGLESGVASIAAGRYHACV